MYVCMYVCPLLPKDNALHCGRLIYGSIPVCNKPLDLCQCGYRRPPPDDVFGWGKSQFNPVGMNLQPTVQLLAPAPGRRSLIWHGNHGNQVGYYCGAGPVAEREREDGTKRGEFRGMRCDSGAVRWLRRERTTVSCCVVGSLYKCSAVACVAWLAVGSTVLVKLTVPQLLNTLPHFMEPDCSLPCLQQRATCPYTGKR